MDLDRRLITVWRGVHGTTKASDLRHVLILDPLLPVLRRWRLKHPGDLVFTNQRGKMLDSGARVFQDARHRILDRASFESPTVNGKRRWYITFHGLRHTFASHWMMNGGDLFKLQRILGHKSVEMTMRYSHLAPDAFAADFDRLGSGVPAQPPGAVVELPASSRG